MLALRAFRFAVVTALLVTLASTSSPPAYARARLIAVVTFRSTVAAHHDAVLASRALAARLAQEPGWDATTINPGARDPADAAAAVGAEVYVIGQYFPGRPARIAGASFRVATTQRLNDFSFSLSDGHTVPASVSFANVVAFAESLTPATATPIPQTQAPPNEQVVVPRGTIIVVAMDHLVNSYSAASREPLSYTVTQDVVLNGHVVAKSGDEGTGIVLEAQQGNQGGPYGIGWKAANLRVDVEAVHNFCGDTIPMEFIRSEYRRRQGLFGSHQDLEIVKGQKYLATVARTTKVCGETTNESPLTPPSDALPPDDAQSVAVPQAEVQVQASREQAAPPVTVQSQSTASSSARALISPPANWPEERKASLTTDVETLGYWRSPQSAGENLEVVAQTIPPGIQPSEFADLILRNLQNAVGASNVHAFKNERICGGKQDGWFIESEVTVGITPVIAEQTLGLSGSQSYVATYRRPATTPESVAAREALDTLCAQADA